jgi:hypothetical protein
MFVKELQQKQASHTSQKNYTLFLCFVYITTLCHFPIGSLGA